MNIFGWVLKGGIKLITGGFLKDKAGKKETKEFSKKVLKKLDKDSEASVRASDDYNYGMKEVERRKELKKDGKQKEKN